MAPGSTYPADEALLAHNTAKQNTNDDEQPTDSMSVADNTSETSTVKYEWDNYESFTTYKYKMLEAAAKHLKCRESDIDIEHIKGGSFNRVAALKLRKAPNKLSLRWLKSQAAYCLGRHRSSARNQYDEYIFRVPRDREYSDITPAVGLLQFAAHHVALPVPELVVFDLTRDNALKNCHMIIKRLDGDILYRLWPSLNFEQKRSAAKQVAKLVPQIAASFHGPPGELSEDNLNQPEDAPVIINKLFSADDGKPIVSPPGQTCLEHILELNENNRHNYKYYPQFWDEFPKIAHALQERGFLDGPAVFVHGDLGPHNIIATIDSSTTIKITGIIDWDMAAIAPEVTAYHTPCWLWATTLSSHAELSNEELVAPTPEHQIIKDDFFALISDQDKKFYTAPEAILARSFYEVMKTGLPGDWETAQAQKVLREWAEEFPKDQVNVVEYLDAEGNRIRRDDDDEGTQEDEDDSDDSHSDSSDGDSDSSDGDEDGDEDEDEDEKNDMMQFEVGDGNEDDEDISADHKMEIEVVAKGEAQGLDKSKPLKAWMCSMRIARP